jgi:large subunit ribosomal protein L5
MSAQAAKAPRLKEFYRGSVVPGMIEQFGFKNPFQVPRLVKVVINMGVNDAKEDIKSMDHAAAEVAAITGQKPQVRRAKKSISNFKLRAGMPIAVRVTLRGNRMYEFLDRFINASIPRIRDFRGLDPRAFDGQGNFNLGLNEQHIFPEVDLEKSPKVRGLNVTVVTTASSDEQARALLSLFGMPFKNPEREAGARKPKVAPAGPAAVTA